MKRKKPVLYDVKIVHGKSEFGKSEFSPSTLPYTKLYKSTVPALSTGRDKKKYSGCCIGWLKDQRRISFEQH